MDNAEQCFCMCDWRLLPQLNRCVGSSGFLCSIIFWSLTHVSGLPVSPIITVNDPTVDHLHPDCGIDKPSRNVIIKKKDHCVKTQNSQHNTHFCIACKGNTVWNYFMLGFCDATPYPVSNTLVTMYQTIIFTTVKITKSLKSHTHQRHSKQLFQVSSSG
jgi:hypothetical protein